MNKDTPLDELEVSNSDARIVGEMSILNGVSDMNKFLKWRLSYYTGRPNMMHLSKLAGINSMYDFLEISRAISITDTLWVNTEKFPTTWDKINPYKTRISKISADLALNGPVNYNNQVVETASPQYTLDGSTEKCVKRDKDGRLYIYKTDGERVGDKIGVRPYSEYYASLVASQLGYKWYTQYKVELHTGVHDRPQPYCKCPIFTNEDTGLIQYSESEFRDMTIQEFDNQLSNMNTTKGKLMRKHLREMLLLDSIIVNPDRHPGNIGFIIDNNTFEIQDMSPIYDNDCSLGALYSIQDISFEEAYNMVCTQRLPKTNTGDYNDTARYAMTQELYNKLKQVNHISLGKAVPGISQNRVDFMEYLVNRRIKEILDLYE